jgi:hypothetical protein
MPIEIKEVIAVGPGWNRVRGSDGNEYTLKGDYNWRSNNPGNIEWGDFARSQGAIASGAVPKDRARGFAIFPTLEAGERARANLQFNSRSYKNLTVAQAIERYAPSFENNTRAYANTVAKAAGVSLNTRMGDLNSQQRQAFLQAQSRVEGMRPGQILNAKGIRLPPADIPTVGTKLSVKQSPTPVMASAAVAAKRAQGHNVPLPKARPVQGKAPTALQESLNARSGSIYGKNQPAGPVAAPSMSLARYGAALASAAPARVSDTMLTRMQPQQKVAPAPRPAGDALIARTTALNKTAMAPYPTIATTRLPALGPAPTIAMPRPRPQQVQQVAAAPKMSMAIAQSLYANGGPTRPGAAVPNRLSPGSAYPADTMSPQAVAAVGALAQTPAQVAQIGVDINGNRAKVAPTPFSRPAPVTQLAAAAPPKVAPTPMAANMRPNGMAVASALSVTPPRPAVAPVPQQRPGVMPSGMGGPEFEIVGEPMGPNLPKTLIGSASKSNAVRPAMAAPAPAPIAGRIPLSQMMQTPGIDPNRLTRPRAPGWP